MTIPQTWRKKDIVEMENDQLIGHIMNTAVFLAEKHTSQDLRVMRWSITEMLKRCEGRITRAEIDAKTQEILNDF